MNESRFLFVLDMIVLNFLDEGRRTYSLYRMCVLSLIILLALQSSCFSYKTVTEDCLKPVILLLIFIVISSVSSEGNIGILVWTSWINITNNICLVLPRSIDRFTVCT